MSTRVASLTDLQAAGCLTVQADGHTLALFLYDGAVYAVDNRCPHMGFPLDKGTVKDGILTCHWHHARFDLGSGGTFDQWADDVQAFPAAIHGDDIFVDLNAGGDRHTYYRQRLRVGLERNISLVIGKSVIHLLDNGGDPVVPFRAGLEFGTAYRQAGWGQGLTILACLMNIVPKLRPEDRPRALYHGLSAVAADSAGHPARFSVSPLPNAGSVDLATLKRWFRQFIEVRDDEGAERCIVSAIRAGADDKVMADMLFAAATDHRYLQTGHVLDFINKAFAALDIAGWDLAEAALTAQVRALATATRMEETNAWRYPVDLVAILDDVYTHLPAALAQGAAAAGAGHDWRAALAPTLLDDDPQATAHALLAALENGCAMADLAAAVSYAAARRIAHFHTSNEFGDWDTALHTFTYANAVEQGLRRAPSPELLRGVFDAAMSVYLDRFLNIPSARLPEPNGNRPEQGWLPTLAPLLDRQQQVRAAALATAGHLADQGDDDALLAELGALLLREDRDFHTIQTVEAAFKQYERLRGEPAGSHVLIAAARYLAAHAPTVRAQGQTYQIANRLHRGEKLFEG